MLRLALIGIIFGLVYLARDEMAESGNLRPAGYSRVPNDKISDWAR